MPNLVGQTLLSQFRVDAFIASGSMGAVYRVWDLQRNVSLAIKVLHDKYAGDSAALEYLQREAWALKELEHPNIVRFYGLYRSPKYAFLLEDFVNGESLKQILERRNGKPFTLNEVMPYFKAICTSLHYAHLKGIVHCDIKPGNVLVDTDGKIYLADFSIANIGGVQSASSGWAGTPAYMAPEQIQSEKTLPQTDVYALGIMLFELLSGGIRPFNSKVNTGDVERYASIQWEHLHARPPSMSAYNAKSTADIDKIILRCLEKQPQQRYPSPLVFLDDLVQANSVLAGQQVVRKASKPVVGGNGEQKVLGSRKNPSGSWTWALLIGIGLLVTLLFISFKSSLSGYIPPPPGISATQVSKAADIQSTATRYIPTPTKLSPMPTRVIPTQTPFVRIPTPTAKLKGPQTFPMRVCMSVPLGGVNRVDECVTGITVLADGRVQYEFTWAATMEGTNDVLIKPDSSNNMYLTDNLGRRYDYLQKGGAALQSLVLSNGQVAVGWFLFPPADINASFFVFHDADNMLQTAPIPRLWP